MDDQALERPNIDYENSVPLSHLFERVENNNSETTMAGVYRCRTLYWTALTFLGAISPTLLCAISV